MHGIAKVFMHLFIFLHTPVINLCAISWAPKQWFPQLCIAQREAGHETRESCFSFPGLFFVLQQQAESGLLWAGCFSSCQAFSYSPCQFGLTVGYTGLWRLNELRMWFWFLSLSRFGTFIWHGEGEMKIKPGITSMAMQSTAVRLARHKIAGYVLSIGTSPLKTALPQFGSFYSGGHWCILF